jgi:cobyrinic acid a,c-diamide synthase
MTKAVMITGTHSGVGKTTISLGLMAALTRRGLSVAPYKVGPDYIDTSHHSAISNKPSRNLDTYIMGIEGVRKTFMKGQSSDISIIEGVMGLYDGMEATEIASSAHVAKTLGVPVVLIINVHGMSRSVAAVVKGYQMLDPDVNIKGLILNMVGSPRHRQLVEDGLKSAGLDIPVIGSFPSNKELSLPSRHLGLHMAHEHVPDYNKLADFVDANMDLETLLQISSIADFPIDMPADDINKHDVTIGVAMDAAFCFYYHDMLEELRNLCDKVILFSPLSDTLPDVDGLILGGGYPELFPVELSSSGAINDIRKAALDGMPIYAECGGLMYLGKYLEVEGKTYKMAGVLDAGSRMVGRLQALGYTSAKVISNNPLSSKGQIMRGHEFHYSVTECEHDVRFAYEMQRGKGIQDGKDGLITYNTLASYMHSHPGSTSMERFVNTCKDYSRQ